MTRNCKIDPETGALILVMLLVVSLILIRSCIPAEYHHPAERPPTPPESFYK